jgi:hypothetical protein
MGIDVANLLELGTIVTPIYIIEDALDPSLIYRLFGYSKP